MLCLYQLPAKPNRRIKKLLGVDTDSLLKALGLYQIEDFIINLNLPVQFLSLWVFTINEA